MKSITDLIQEHGLSKVTEQLCEPNHLAFSDPYRLEHVLSFIEKFGNVVFINQYHLRFQNGAVILFRDDECDHDDAREEYYFRPTQKRLKAA